MPDFRELFDEPEEALRAAWAGIQKHLFTAMPVSVSTDSDGKTSTLQLSIKRTVQDQTLTTTTYEDFPLLADVPIKFAGGGGLTHTHPVKQGDEGLVIFNSRPIDTWFQSGPDPQQPISDRMHSLADAIHVPGIRSTPRELKQISTDSSQNRSDDAHHVDDLHPTNGFKRKSVDPSTAPASDAFNPFTDAATFFEHILHPSNGSAINATSDGTTHAQTVDHTNGAMLSALNNLHQVKAHPTLGALLSGENGAHTVTAGPAGVSLQSAIAIALEAPSISMPSGSLGGDALASGAASDNIGALGGDLAGSLPDPQVVGILNVTGANMLPNFSNDTTAAAGGVQVGHLYRNGSTLCVRVA